MANVDSYLSLITSEHQNRPRFRAMVGTVAGCFVNQQNLLLSIPYKFDLEQAVGSQLDAIGRWVGITRSVIAPIEGMYFSLDTAGAGWNQGIWWSSLSPAPLTYVAYLDDDTYRLLIQAKIAANQYDGTLGGLVTILQELFAPATVTVTDNMDMTVSVAVHGNPPSSLFKYIVQGGYLPIKPAGVGITYSFS